MNTQFHIPDFAPLYREVLEFVKEHLGEKGYIDTQNLNNFHDDIYTLMYNYDEQSYIELKVYGIRAVDDELHILPEAVTRSFRVVYSDKDFKKSDDWEGMRDGDIMFAQTLLNIAETIEEYV